MDPIQISTVTTDRILSLTFLVHKLFSVVTNTRTQTIAILITYAFQFHHTSQPLVVLRTGVSDVCIPACICIHFLAFNYIAASSTAYLIKCHTAGECSFADWMTSCYVITKLVSYEFSNFTAALEKLIWQKLSMSVHLYIKCRQKHGLSHQLMEHTVKKTVNYCCSLTIYLSPMATCCCMQSEHENMLSFAVIL